MKSFEDYGDRLGNVLQVLYISVLCGFALSWMGQAGKPINDLIEASSQMLFRIVAVVMWAAPLGAFGTIAFTVGRFGTASLFSLGELLISFYLTCLIFVFGVLQMDTGSRSSGALEPGSLRPARGFCGAPCGARPPMAWQKKDHHAIFV